MAKTPAKSKISKLFISNIPKVIAFSQLIQNLKTKNPNQKGIHHEIFLNKAKSWLDGIPNDIQTKYDLEKLYKKVAKGVSDLKAKTKTWRFCAVASD